MSDDHHDLGSSEEVDEARKQIAEVEEHNDEAVLGIVSAIQQKVAQEKALLDAIANVSPHLITRFLLTQAAATIGVAERLMSAALELGVPEGETAPTPPSIDSVAREEDPGTGQYL